MKAIIIFWNDRVTKHSIEKIDWRRIKVFLDLSEAINLPATLEFKVVGEALGPVVMYNKDIVIIVDNEELAKEVWGCRRAIARKIIIDDYEIDYVEAFLEIQFEE